MVWYFCHLFLTLQNMADKPHESIDTTPDTSPKEPVDSTSAQETAKISKDTETSNAKKEVYEVRDALIPKSGLDKANKIISDMEWGKITPQDALKKMHELATVLNAAFVPPVF